MLFGHRLFASSLTGTLFCVFLYPLLTVTHLAFDENVQFWIGYYPLLTLLIPLIWMLAHMYHVYIGKGNRAVVTFAFTCPCVLFFLVGGSILFQATHVVDGLLTADCAHFRAIRPVEQAYQDAETVLKKCQDEQQNANLLLQHCKNYIDDYDSESHADNWPYLQFVERNYNCHGFCEATGVGLWTRDGGMDACSVAVASVIRGRIQHAAWQLMLYSVDGETVRTGRASRELEDKPKGKLVSDLPKDRIKRDVYFNFAEGPCNDLHLVDVSELIGKMHKKPDITGESRDVDVNKVATYGLDRKLAAYERLKAQKKK